MKPASPFAVTGIDHLALSVTDVKRSVAFYQEHLELRVSRDGGDGSTFLSTSGTDFVAFSAAKRHGCITSASLSRNTIRTMPQRGSRPRGFSCAARITWSNFLIPMGSRCRFTREAGS
jgi:catechol 2,3-dioxygenase-like lactoylglutathione lyase family enzyme